MSHAAAGEPRTLGGRASKDAGGQLHRPMTGFPRAFSHGLAFVGAVGMSACAPAHHSPRANPALIVLSQATEVRWSDMYDGQVTYKISEGYPAHRSITDIQTRLGRLGW